MKRHLVREADILRKTLCFLPLVALPQPLLSLSRSIPLLQRVLPLLQQLSGSCMRGSC